jgi:hypothetical protein
VSRHSGRTWQGRDRKLRVDGKKFAGTARVKALRITTQEKGRLVARRARGHTHREVGMNSWQDRLAAILTFTRSILVAACWNSSFISMRIYLRPVRSAAAQVEADPQKASCTMSPGSEYAMIMGTRDITAFCVGCSLLPAIRFTPSPVQASGARAEANKRIHVVPFLMDRFGGRSRHTRDLWQVVGHTDAPGIRTPEMRMKRCGVTSTKTMTRSVVSFC